MAVSNHQPPLWNITAMTEKDACVLFVASMSFLSFIRYLLECVNIEHGLLLSRPLSPPYVSNAVTHTDTHSVRNFCINFQTKNNSLVFEHSTHYCNYKPPQATTVQLIVPSHPLSLLHRDRQGQRQDAQMHRSQHRLIRMVVKVLRVWYSTLAHALHVITVCC